MKLFNDMLERLIMRLYKFKPGENKIRILPPLNQPVQSTGPTMLAPDLSKRIWKHADNQQKVMQKKCRWLDAVIRKNGMAKIKDDMALMQELYAQFGPDGGGNYGPMLAAIAPIRLQVDENNYQGDSWVLYRDAARGWGFLVFGWGSCSGCDLLQACNQWEETASLFGELKKAVKWFRTAGECLDYMEQHDWKGDHFGSNAQFLNLFLEPAKTILMSVVIFEE